MKRKSKHSKQENKFKKLSLMFLILFFIIGIIYIVCYFHNGNKDKKEYSEILNNIEIDNTKITPQKTEKMLKLEELQKENTDIIRVVRN